MSAELATSCMAETTGEQIVQHARHRWIEGDPSLLDENWPYSCAGHALTPSPAKAGDAIEHLIAGLNTMLGARPQLIHEHVARQSGTKLVHWTYHVRGPVLAELDRHGGEASVKVWAQSSETIGECHDVIQEWRREEERAANDHISLALCHDVKGDLRTHHTEVFAPELGAIYRNYPAETREALVQVSESVGRASGKLMIWHGPTGTGKTYAARSIARAYADAGYQPVLVNEVRAFLAEGRYYADLCDRYAEPMLIILEDAARYLLRENRLDLGDEMSRLLNVTDGLSGAGRNDMFLITFNEPIAEIDPALRRPGRAAAIIEFREFAPNEAIHWLQAHGADEQGVDGSMPLAALYERIGQEQIISEEVSEQTGFK